MKQNTFNSKRIFTIIAGLGLCSCASFLTAKDEAAKKEATITSNDTKESLSNNKNLENYNEQNISRITFSENINEVNVKSTANSKEITFEAWASDNSMGIYAIENNNAQNRNVIIKKFKTSTNPAYDSSDKNIYFTTVHENKEIKNGVLMYIHKSGLGGMHVIPLKNEGLITSLAVSSKNDIAISQATPKGNMIQIINSEKNYHLDLIPGDEINWSYDGEKIIFTSKDNLNKRSVFLIDKDGSNLVQLTSFTEDIASPCFSPDGKWVCFAGQSKTPVQKEAKKEESSNWDIFILNREDSKLIQITKDVGADISPYWAKDGNIYFSSNRFGNYEIMKIKPQVK